MCCMRCALEPVNGVAAAALSACHQDETFDKVPRFSSNARVANEDGQICSTAGLFLLRWNQYQQSTRVIVAGRLIAGSWEGVGMLLR